MNLIALLGDKSVKPKEKTQAIAEWILADNARVSELIEVAKTLKDPGKATCIEALEFASKQKPACITKDAFEFVTAALNEKAPRIKWESAKVIGNTAHLNIKKLDDAIDNLLRNTQHAGTVVRWSAAFALGEILKLNTPHNKSLSPALNSIMEKEEKNSIKKIYQSAFKKTR